MQQHYVPRCYLKGFSNVNGFLYSVNLKKVERGYNEKANKRNISKICVLDDHYNIRKEYDSSTFKFNQYDEVYIESTVLHKNETKYQEIRDKIISGVNVKSDDLDFFADFIVQLKLRNLYWYEQVLKKRTKGWIESAITNISKQIEENMMFAAIPKGLKQLLVTDFKLKSIADEDFAKKMNLHSLIQRQNPNNPHSVTLKKYLLDGSWILWEAPETTNHFFITSDNPGYSIGLDGEPVNTKFNDGFSFYLPLTSRHCLVITDQLPNKPELLTKFIIPEDTVRVMNLYACHVINERILGYRKDELDELTNFLKSWKV